MVSITSLADHYKVLISHTNPLILHKEASSKCRTVKNSSTLVENYTKAARSDTYFTGDIAWRKNNGKTWLLMPIFLVFNWLWTGNKGCYLGEAQQANSPRPHRINHCRFLLAHQHVICQISSKSTAIGWYLNYLMLKALIFPDKIYMTFLFLHFFSFQFQEISARINY